MLQKALIVLSWAMLLEFAALARQIYRACSCALSRHIGLMARRNIGEQRQVDKLAFPRHLQFQPFESCTYVCLPLQMGCNIKLHIISASILTAGSFLLNWIWTSAF